MKQIVGFIAMIIVLAACGEMAEAQQAGKIWRIGFLSSVSPEPSAHLYQAFLQGLDDFGSAANSGRRLVLPNANRQRIADLAIETRLPAIYEVQGVCRLCRSHELWNGHRRGLPAAGNICRQNN